MMPEAMPQAKPEAMPHAKHATYATQLTGRIQDQGAKTYVPDPGGAVENGAPGCLARLGSDPCHLLWGHTGQHRTVWGTRAEVAVIWSDGDGLFCHPDPRAVI